VLTTNSPERYPFPISVLPAMAGVGRASVPEPVVTSWDNTGRPLASEGLNRFPLGIGRLSTADFAGQLPRFRSTPSEESSIDRSPACARADETFYLLPY
jgi:hypothetical protein